MALDSAHETKKHPRKEANEDFCSVNYFLESDISLFLVCDGVSGKEGEIGSHLAANFLRDGIRESIRKTLSEDKTKPKQIKQIIADEFKRTSERMLNETKAATTLELALFDHETQILHTAHSGDSEMYLIKGNAEDSPFLGARIEQFTTPNVDRQTGGPETRLGPGGYNTFDYQELDIGTMEDEHVFLFMTTDWIRERNLRDFTLKRGFDKYKRGDDLHSILSVIIDFYEQPQELLLDKIKNWMTRDKFDYVLDELRKLGFTPDLEKLNITDDNTRSDEKLNNILYEQRMKVFSQILSSTSSDNETWVKRLALIYDTADGKIYDDFAAVVVDLKGARRKYYKNKISGTEDEVTRKNSEIKQLTTRAESAETSLTQANTQLAERDGRILDLEQKIKGIKSRQSESDKVYRATLEDAAFHICLSLDYDERKKTRYKEIEGSEKDKFKQMTNDELQGYIKTNFNKLAKKARESKGILERCLEKVGTILSAFNCWYREYRSKEFQEMKDRLSSSEKKLRGVTEKLELANKQIEIYTKSYITREEDYANVRKAKDETERKVREKYDKRIGTDLFTKQQVEDKVLAEIAEYRARRTPPPLPEDALKSAVKGKENDSVAITSTQQPIRQSTISLGQDLAATQHAGHEPQTVILPNTPDEASDSDSNAQPASPKTLVEIINEKTTDADETVIRRYIAYGLFYILDKRKKTKEEVFDYTSQKSGAGEEFGKQLRRTIEKLYKLEKKKEKTTEDKRKMLTTEQIKSVDGYIKQESDKWKVNDNNQLRHNMMVDFLREIYNVMDHNKILADKKIEEGDKLSEINPYLKKSIDDYFSQTSVPSSTESSQKNKIYPRWLSSWPAIAGLVSVVIAVGAGGFHYYNPNNQPAETESNKAVAHPPATSDKESIAEQSVEKDEQKVKDTDKTRQSANVEKSKLFHEDTKNLEEIKPAKNVMNGEQEALHQQNIFAVINNAAHVYASEFLAQPAIKIAKSTDENPVKLVNDTQQTEIISLYSTNFKKITEYLSNNGYMISSSGNSCTANLESRLETREINMSYDANGITIKEKISRTITRKKKYKHYSYNLIFNNNSVTVQGEYYQLSTDASHNSWIFGCVDNKDCEEPKKRKVEKEAFSSFDIIVEHYIGSKMTFELKEGELELLLVLGGNNTIYEPTPDTKKHAEEYMKVFGKNITEGVKLALTILNYINN